MAGLEAHGQSHVAYEASSHGLDQHRAEGVPLAAAAFTNFSRDHLDYHGRWRSISRPRCGCSRSFCRPASPRSIWTDDPKSDEVMDRAGARA